MSGIAGIFYRNDQPVQLEQLQAMGKALAHRGPDGINYYYKGSVGFVHCMLHDTPESVFEILPNKTEDEKFVITFHGRIDNRRELYDKIGWIKPLSDVTDSDLILAAYRKWRKECVNHLLGDFSFAVWDQIARKIFCARDHMGLMPLYYCEVNNIFVFASEIKGLLAVAGVPRKENEERVADYFTGVVLDHRSTFYSGIYRLPPGHFLEIFQKNISLCSYYKFRPMLLDCNNDQEYEEKFREIFSDSVRVRIRSFSLVGAYLSGGLDSATNVCVAAGLFAKEMSSPLQTFSGIFDKIPNCDEREYFFPILQRYNLISHTLLVDDINPAIAYEKLISDEDEPFWAPHVFMIMELMLLAREAGVRVLLDGHDGDAAISYGYNRFVKLARSGRIFQLVDCYRESGVKSEKDIIKRLLLLYWNIICKMNPLAFSFSKRRKDAVRSLNKLSCNYVKKTGIKNRLILAIKKLPNFGQEEEEYHLNNITQPLHAYALEFLERISVRTGIVSRYPFFDKRVIEFCLALPLEQKFKEGFNRSIVRRAYVDVLPESIKKRKTKTDFTQSILHGFRHNDDGWLLDRVDSIIGARYSHVNESFYRSARRGFCDSDGRISQASLGNLLTLVSYCKWKERF